MFYVYWFIIASLATIIVVNMFRERRPLMQISYGLLLIPFLLRVLVLK